MNYFSVFTVLVLLLLSGCKVDFVSRADNSKIYASATLCSDENASNKESAVDELVKHYPLIAQELKAYVSVDENDVNATHCYDAVVTKKSWLRYERALKRQKEDIETATAQQAKHFEYKDKEILIQAMATERRLFNKKLKSANTLAPLEIEPFALDYKSLENAIDLLPSVTIKIKPCNKGKNIACPVHFMAEVKDESNSLNYRWDFGDGTKAIIKDPSHTYEREGLYNVSLQVSDEHGINTYRSKDVLVTQKNVAKNSGKKSKLKAYFIVSKRAYKVGEEVYFDNRSRCQGSEIEVYEWQFGDGSRGYVRNPRHAYDKAGKYIVKYKVCSEDGHCAYASTSVKINTDGKKAVKKKSTKKVKKRAVKKPKKVVVVPPKRLKIDAKEGEKIGDYIASHGEPSKQVVKKRGSTKAYKFGKVWLLVKYEKIVCAVQEEGFKTTLMGQPKTCNWHRKYAGKYMAELQK